MIKNKYLPIGLPASLYGSKLIKAEKTRDNETGKEIVRLLFEVDEVEVGND